MGEQEHRQDRSTPSQLDIRAVSTPAHTKEGFEEKPEDALEQAEAAFKEEERKVIARRQAWETYQTALHDYFNRSFWTVLTKRREPLNQARTEYDDTMAGIMDNSTQLPEDDSSSTGPQLAEIREQISTGFFAVSLDESKLLRLYEQNSGDNNPFRQRDGVTDTAKAISDELRTQLQDRRRAYRTASERLKLSFPQAPKPPLLQAQKNALIQHVLRVTNDHYHTNFEDLNALIQSNNIFSGASLRRRRYLSRFLHNANEAKSATSLTKHLAELTVNINCTNWIGGSELAVKLAETSGSDEINLFERPETCTAREAFATVALEKKEKLDQAALSFARLYKYRKDIATMIDTIRYLVAHYQLDPATEQRILASEDTHAEIKKLIKECKLKERTSALIEANTPPSHLVSIFRNIFSNHKKGEKKNISQQMSFIKNLTTSTTVPTRLIIGFLLYHIENACRKNHEDVMNRLSQILGLFIDSLLQPARSRVSIEQILHFDERLDPTISSQLLKLVKLYKSLSLNTINSADYTALSNYQDHFMMAVERIKGEMARSAPEPLPSQREFTRTPSPQLPAEAEGETEQVKLANLRELVAKHQLPRDTEDKLLNQQHLRLDQALEQAKAQIEVKRIANNRENFKNHMDTFKRMVSAELWNKIKNTHIPSITEQCGAEDGQKRYYKITYTIVGYLICKYQEAQMVGNHNLAEKFHAALFQFITNQAERYESKRSISDILNAAQFEDPDICQQVTQLETIYKLQTLPILSIERQRAIEQYAQTKIYSSQQPAASDSLGREGEPRTFFDDGKPQQNQMLKQRTWGEYWGTWLPKGSHTSNPTEQDSKPSGQDPSA